MTAKRTTLASLRKQLADREAYERSLLTPEQLREFDEQNRLLVATNEDPITVAEYLKCRLDDATGADECVF